MNRHNLGMNLMTSDDVILSRVHLGSNIMSNSQCFNYQSTIDGEITGY